MHQLGYAVQLGVELDPSLSAAIAWTYLMALIRTMHILSCDPIENSILASKSIFPHASILALNTVHNSEMVSLS